eukprot:CAMPEP_0196589690 /NCGR_PEP_ID=MMETSP1081-20130531/64316_1 /TAXON_ID=36882 /ORGANISM="Pyramimonas amylifera, Strain CCMP720" /LENGTH=238 /DNA_ID=CAMNT_0041912557 /DNA_START=233 /DNA_END=949 /DNA_ORIENTATION=+
MGASVQCIGVSTYRPNLKPLTVNGSNNEIRICTNKVCRKQGSYQILQDFKDLVDPAQVQVIKTGCLGKCGEGPNVAMLPSGLVLKHVSTTAHVARLVERQCAGGAGVPAVFQAMQLRVSGNACFQAGDSPGAEALYSKALALDSPYNIHLLLGNRSAVRLAMGDAQGALEDANLAIELMPDWAKGFIRKADALEALGDYPLALEARVAALEHDVQLTKSDQFVAAMKATRSLALQESI